MTTLDSSVESSMDNNTNNKPRQATSKGRGGGDGDPEVWQTLDRSFRQVQTVLDRNRVLIQQVNENHQSKVPDNMVKNVALIQELNGNISKVASLYSDLNTNFSSMFHQRKNGTGGANTSRG